MSQDDRLPDFKGKIVTFYCANIPPEYATSLVSPSFEQQAGRLFVVGNSATHLRSHWDDGLYSAVAWDQVASYVVFESLDEYQTRVQTHSNDGPSDFDQFRRN